MVHSDKQIIGGLSRRILDISYRNHLSHIGSCLTALPILYQIYKNKKSQDKVVLSAGHAGLALYVVQELFGILPNAEKTLLRDGIHPTYNEKERICVSTGSLGLGITQAVGFAMFDSKRDVYVISSDGEITEGAFWEAIYYKWKTQLNNLHIFVNDNGWTALGKSVIPYTDLANFGVKVIDTKNYVPHHLQWFQKLDQHYQMMNEQQYKELYEYYSQPL